LHFGSLVCAVASFAQAKARGGTWLVRMEDLDPPREMAGAADDILRTLAAHRLAWDEPVSYQSQRHDRYQYWLDKLLQNGLAYRCRCSRKQIQEQQQALGINVYPGICKGQFVDTAEQHAVRLNGDDQTVSFQDHIQGQFGQNIAREVGDFVVRRADGWFAYQLAVVVDDEEQRITEVVRGSDLLDNTPRQIYLQQLLKMRTPDYAHIPVATTGAGEKLSKQTFAKPVDNQHAVRNLVQCLTFLGQRPPPAQQFDDLEALWQWAIQHWNIDAVPGVTGICAES
jgi:glutamyl-Q tRNA(Asp) synthetase